jgi:hypothetical protein
MLNHASASKYACKNANNAGRFVNVFLEAAIQNMLQQAREAVGVFGSNDHNRVSAFHCRRETRILAPFTRIVDGQIQFGDIDQFGCHALA